MTRIGGGGGWEEEQAGDTVGRLHEWAEALGLGGRKVVVVIGRVGEVFGIGGGVVVLVVLVVGVCCASSPI